jgi:hypothetical protein
MMHDSETAAPPSDTEPTLTTDSREWMPFLARSARRVRQKVTRKRKRDLKHVKEQARDAYAARLRCQKRGLWQLWYKEAGLGRTMARHSSESLSGSTRGPRLRRG